MKKFPWWGSVLLAVIAYCSLKYATPRLLSPESSLSELFSLFAPIIAMGLLLLSGKQLYDSSPVLPDESDDSAPPQAPVEKKDDRQ